MAQAGGDTSAPLATLALALTIDEWNVLGLGTSGNPESAPTSDIDLLVERTTALLLVRVVACVAPLGTYPDLSTSNICRSTLMKNAPWPAKVTKQIIDQLREFAKRTLTGYKDVPYHNREHAFHVILSTNKLIDMMVSQSRTDRKKKPPVTFGLRNDPHALFALVFSALIHDVEHQGIPNRQLAMEDDRLAVLYNDQSIAENWSIYVAFSELLQDEFKHLRQLLFPAKDVYYRFRKMVINLVLATDIASPERTQLVKSKWKEAFGDPIETVERKLHAQARRMSLTGQNISIQRTGRRGTGDTGVSDVSYEPMSPSSQLNDTDYIAEQESPSVTPENSDREDDPPQLAPPDALSETQRNRLVQLSRRRSSTASRTTTSSRYRQRLGILRTVDLSGETLENYSRSASMDHANLSLDRTFHPVDLDEDEPNDLNATVVMETIMLAADVAHNLQGWDLMVKFADRLYLELRKSFVDKRGSDPEPKWFENQIGFLESYLMPLAHRLADTGVFGEKVGEQFAKAVEGNRDQWLTDGFDVAQKIVEEGAKLYPLTE